MKFASDFRELYKRYAGDVYRFSLFLCSDPVEAEDITAETFTRALTGNASPMSVTVKGYLLTIARNLHLEKLRRRREITELPTELPDPLPHPERALIQKNELEELRAYLQTFPETDRSALLLRADGLAYDDIASALGISLASARVKVHRLRMKLAEWRAKH